ncbi:hypothetical protein JK358_07115 [Nocardia sp. 2]|uniref:DUF3592 domain-containing protein n=1 Tax=Nocardia acididurans TaxID=2802282 RepID=A0ABS1M0G1_9NOCA|nr:hypothetical protein [Nocardia acididurans]MBL1074163.1 hypothetical protein [Nocardia acididurans]
MRASDRAEVVIRALAVVAVVVAVPLSGALGTVSYTGAAARIAAEDTGKVRVVANIAEDSRVVLEPDRYGVRTDRYQAAVQWNYEGHHGKATIDVTGPQTVGAEVPLWIDREGQPTTAPARPGAAAAEGIGTGLAVLVETWCAAAAAVWFSGALLDARRNARWDREWRLMNRPIGKDTL